MLAGTNGAGKSSILGASILEEGAIYFNPDDYARRLRQTTPALGIEEANGLAWNAGRQMLETAIAERCDFAFETTLEATPFRAFWKKRRARVWR